MASNPPTVRLRTCPAGCGTPTVPQHGHPSLCLPCTEKDIGMTLAELQARVNERLAKGRTRKWRR
ncbi:MAG TPA: hypothetical protein VFW64_12500 [Pseudonocardiaceae bacterium]|nr:hypothetical protein [Pseudonocardiaceae bacterium]